MTVIAQLSESSHSEFWSRLLRISIQGLAVPPAGQHVWPGRCSTLISPVWGLFWSSILYVDLTRCVEGILNLGLWILWIPVSGCMFQEGGLVSELLLLSGMAIFPQNWAARWLWHANLGWFLTHIRCRITQGSGFRILSIYVSNFPRLPSELQC